MFTAGASMPPNNKDAPAFKPDKIARQVVAYEALGQGNFVLFSDYELIDSDGAVTGRAHMAPVLGDTPAIARFRGAINQAAGSRVIRLVPSD
jgi:hypothetical protein